MDWETPQWLFQVLDTEFHFTLDVCANALNHKVPRYHTPEADGLAQNWVQDTCWMNPPYGSEIVRWVAKAHACASAGGLVVALVPARTDTRWWFDYCTPHEIRFLKGRIRFTGAPASAPFPSAVIVFGRPPASVWWDTKKSKE